MGLRNVFTTEEQETQAKCDSLLRIAVSVPLHPCGRQLLYDLAKHQSLLHRVGQVANAEWFLQERAALE